MGPPSYMRSVVDLSVVMRRFIVLNVYKFFHSCPINPVFLTLHEISAVPLQITKEGQSDTVCFDLLFIPVSFHILSCTSVISSNSVNIKVRLVTLGWLVNDCLQCLPEGWLSWTGDSHCFAQSPKGNHGTVPHINP